MTIIGVGVSIYRSKQHQTQRFSGYKIVHCLKSVVPKWQSKLIELLQIKMLMEAVLINEFNKTMSSQRICVEWGFDEGTRTFAYVNFKRI